MNAVEIEEAVSELAATPCDLNEFPFAFLAAFGNKKTTLDRLRKTGKGGTNKSDVDGGVLQRLNIHIAVTEVGNAEDTLRALRESPQTAKAKAKYILATDGERIEAEELASGDVLSCAFSELGDHFGFFLTLAGISAVREVKDNPIDIKATSRLNKLYVELLKHNPEWATAEGQIAFNQFLARLVFCFFAEDTGVFGGKDLFTNAVSQMTETDGSNTHEILQELFKAMDSDPRNGGRKPPVKSWADKFPYVNGGLFSGSTDCPTFTRTARSYLLRAGELDWQAINPDIFGSMIQAVADDDERGSLGMHYTSVPNIEKVLNPLFLDDLREQLEAAGDNARKLLNLRKRLATIRVFDPACGSGNFLVIAYIRMREIEAELMKRRGEPMSESIIKLTQFYGIEIKPFAVEVARLSLLIAEFQCNVRLIGQRQAQMLILPLHETGHVLPGNALRMEWRDVCPHTDKFETYLCGNPPYLGARAQSTAQKKDLEVVFQGSVKGWGVLDYVAGWFYKFAVYSRPGHCTAAFVSTNSICQGQQTLALWQRIFEDGCLIEFAYEGFRWRNLASKNAAVTVVIIGLSRKLDSAKRLLICDESDGISERKVSNINGYLVPFSNVFVNSSSSPISKVPEMMRGSAPVDDGELMFDSEKYKNIIHEKPQFRPYLLRAVGGADYINDKRRWILRLQDDEHRDELSEYFHSALSNVADFRSKSKKKATRDFANKPGLYPEDRYKAGRKIFVPQLQSEGRDELIAGVLPTQDLALAPHFQLFTDDVYALSLLVSRIHLVWVATVCGKMKTDFRYSNTLGWNTFPVPSLTEKNRADLTRCAEDILLAREAHFPATIADLYKPDAMPADLRAAHDRNDETLERIYIGRRFKNDTERLEKLFALYTEMTSEAAG